MPHVINFDKGSKRRMRQIRWNIFERASALALFVALSAICIQVALCDSSRKPEQPGSHFDRDR